MDAETRHALKQNDLAEALTHVKDYAADPSVRRWISAIVLLILVFVAFRVWRWSARSSAEAEWAAFGNVMQFVRSEPEKAITGLQDLIESSSNHNLRAAAHLLYANVRTDQIFQEPAKATTYAEQAVSGLKAVINDRSVAKEYVVAAHYKLAGVYETLGKIDEARQQYEAITNDSRFAGSPYMELANEKLSSLDELARLPEFLPGTAPAPEPPSGPAGPSATFTPPMEDAATLNDGAISPDMSTMPEATEDEKADSPSDAPSSSDDPADVPANEPATP
ncbi:MAG: tetratricopeptide repeat protein [Phycisphaerae bacterium]